MSLLLQNLQMVTLTVDLQFWVETQLQRLFRHCCRLLCLMVISPHCQLAPKIPVHPQALTRSPLKMNQVLTSSPYSNPLAYPCWLRYGISRRYTWNEILPVFTFFLLFLVFFVLEMLYNFLFLIFLMLVSFALHLLAEKAPTLRYGFHVAFGMCFPSFHLCPTFPAFFVLQMEFNC